MVQTALSRINLIHVVLGIGSIFGFIGFLTWTRDYVKSSMETIGTQADKKTYTPEPLVAMFTPKKALTLDTRGVTDISSMAGTYSQQGLWGGKDTHEHNHRQTFQHSNTLFLRGANYHPWSELHRHEVRDKAFKAMYSSRAHH